MAKQEHCEMEKKLQLSEVKNLSMIEYNWKLSALHKMKTCLISQEYYVS